eukprot:1158384-Pelagomonas_calceolata.AAC.15
MSTKASDLILGGIAVQPRAVFQDTKGKKQEHDEHILALVLVCSKQGPHFKQPTLQPGSAQAQAVVLVQTSVQRTPGHDR